jgi:hypothetical protein
MVSKKIRAPSKKQPPLSPVMQYECSESLPEADCAFSPMQFQCEDDFDCAFSPSSPPTASPLPPPPNPHAADRIRGMPKEKQELKEKKKFKKTTPTKAPQTDHDKMVAIMKLQAFDGSWEFNEALAQVPSTFHFTSL